MPPESISIKTGAARTAAMWILGFALFAAFIILNTDLGTFLRYLLLGLPQGAVIALIAVGYTMVYGIIQLINFAHGEVFMMSTYFVLMLVAPSTTTGGVGARVITACVAVIIFCAAWVLLHGVRTRFIRGVVAAAAAAGIAALNYFLMTRAGEAGRALPFMLAFVLAVIYACSLGVSMDFLAYRPLRGSPRLIPLITAIGISLLLQNLAQSIWGSHATFYPAATVPSVLTGARSEGTSMIRITQGLQISRLDIIIIALAVLLMITLQLFILKTRTGKAMRACAQDRVTASLMGIKVNHVVALAFALGAGLAALVAPLYVIRGTPIYPQMGYIVGILAFASAVLGGIGNITGAMLGGLIIGIIYSFVPLFDAPDSFALFRKLEEAGYVTHAGYERFVTRFGRPGQYQLGVAYAFMILIIVFKPTGLLGKASAKRA